MTGVQTCALPIYHNIINCFIGIVYGGISGYFGGTIDNVMMRIVEIINGIPYLLIVILLMMVLPRGTMTIITALVAVGWVGMARLVRGELYGFEMGDESGRDRC